MKRCVTAFCQTESYFEQQQQKKKSQKAYGMLMMFVNVCSIEGECDGNEGSLPSLQAQTFSWSLQSCIVMDIFKNFPNKHADSAKASPLV